MGKKKGKKGLSRCARQELRARKEGREAWENHAKKKDLRKQAQARLVSDKALQRKDSFNFEAVMDSVGWNSLSRDKSLRFRSLAHKAWHKRPGLLSPPYVAGLASLALVPHRGAHTEWTPDGRGLTSGFRGLTTMLFGGYPANVNLIDSLLVSHLNWQAALVTVRVVRAVIGGEKIVRMAGTKVLPPPLTKRMCHLLVNPDRPQTVVEATRRAQILAHGGNITLARALGHDLLGGFASIRAEIYWDEVIHWLCRQPNLNPAQAAPICDYLNERYREDQDYSLKGRTLQSVTRGMNQWHQQLNDLSRFKSLQDFTPSGYAAAVWHKSKIVGGRKVPTEVWALREVRNPRELVSEGTAMRHCVAGYHSAIMAGKSSIWSLTLNNSRQLTIEVHNRQQAVVQVRGKSNRCSRPRENRFIRGWARKNGFKVEEYAL